METIDASQLLLSDPPEQSASKGVGMIIITPFLCCFRACESTKHTPHPKLRTQSVSGMRRFASNIRQHFVCTKKLERDSRFSLEHSPHDDNEKKVAEIKNTIILVGAMFGSNKETDIL